MKKVKKAKQAGGNTADMQQPIEPTPDTQAAQEALNAEDAREEALDTPAAETPAEVAMPDPMQAALDEMTAQRDEYLTLAQRVQADFDNYRRRNQSARAEAFDEGARAFAATLLPVLDNLERAVGAAQDSPDPSLREGVELVCRQLLDAFGKRGITVINRLGEKFDPNLENAVMQGSADEGEPGTVCEVLQKGYQMGNAVLRHAMVKVVAE